MDELNEMTFVELANFIHCYSKELNEDDTREATPEEIQAFLR